MGMLRKRLAAILLLLVGVYAGLYVYQSEVEGTNSFRLGLDLRGGSYLVYLADTSDLEEGAINDSMDSLRDVIERRINAFGIAEPNVQTEEHSIGIEGTEHRLVVELPGVTDLKEATDLIGQTPELEFRIENPKLNQTVLDAQISNLLSEVEGIENEEELMTLLAQVEELEEQRYIPSGLNGSYLDGSSLQFSQGGAFGGGGLTSQPIIALSFNREGAELFEQITRENIGKRLAIFLDGSLESAPTVNAAISGGQAIIEGNYTIDEAKTLVGRLNSGALPISIELISTNSIGPTLGQDAVDRGVEAGVIGIILVAVVLILWYRLPGLIAVLALGVYTALMLWMFKFIPVTLTSAGIAGFIISIGIAVDANILIFERMKEEIRKGATLYDAIANGFTRAWDSIRDANLSSIISAIILFWFGTALIKGFALTFGLGIILSMLTAVSFTRLMLMSLVSKDKASSKLQRWLYGSGLHK